MIHHQSSYHIIWFCKQTKAPPIMQLASSHQPFHVVEPASRHQHLFLFLFLFLVAVNAAAASARPSATVDPNICDGSSNNSHPYFPHILLPFINHHFISLLFGKSIQDQRIYIAFSNFSA